MFNKNYGILFAKQRKMICFLLVGLLSIAMIVFAAKMLSADFHFSNKVLLTPDFIKEKLGTHFGKYMDHIGLLTMGALLSTLLAAGAFLKTKNKQKGLIILYCFAFILLGFLNLRAILVLSDQDYPPIAERKLPVLYMTFSHRFAQFPPEKKVAFFEHDYLRNKVLVVDEDWYRNRDLFERIVVPREVDFFAQKVVFDDVVAGRLIETSTDIFYGGAPDNKLSVFFLGEVYTQSEKVYVLHTTQFRLFVPEALLLRNDLVLPNGKKSLRIEDIKNGK